VIGLVIGLNNRIGQVAKVADAKPFKALGVVVGT